jgi:hypothetical protein
MPMSEEDEVFLEKSFQRTLIVCSHVLFLSIYLYCAVWKGNKADMQELEKLISYSATPTAVWRRTGEICYANPEFCSLVKRNEGDLLQGQRDGEKQYIYQLFSKPSYVPPLSRPAYSYFTTPIIPVITSTEEHDQNGRWSLGRWTGGGMGKE